MFGIKEGPVKTLRYLVVGVVLCAAVGLAGFLGGRYAASHQEAPQLSAVVLEGRLAEISELASVTYTYTNMAQFENSDDFYGMKIPFTTKKFILSYDGTIKAGIDLGDVEIEVRDNDVTVTLPEAEILAMRSTPTAWRSLTRKPAFSTPSPLRISRPSRPPSGR